MQCSAPSACAGAHLPAMVVGLAAAGAAAGWIWCGAAALALGFLEGLHQHCVRRALLQGFVHGLVLLTSARQSSPVGYPAAAEGGCCRCALEVCMFVRSALVCYACESVSSLFVACKLRPQAESTLNRRLDNTWGWLAGWLAGCAVLRIRRWACSAWLHVSGAVVAAHVAVRCMLVARLPWLLRIPQPAIGLRQAPLRVAARVHAGCWCACTVSARMHAHERACPMYNKLHAPCVTSCPTERDSCVAGGWVGRCFAGGRCQQLPIHRDAVRAKTRENTVHALSRRHSCH